MNLRGIALLGLVLILVALAPLAQATIVPPGGMNIGPDIFKSISGTTEALHTGTIVTTAYTTMFTAEVISDPANKICSGCLDFVYMFANEASSTDVNTLYSASNFGGWRTDVGFVMGTGIAPATVGRTSIDGGRTVDFNFPGGDNVMPGENTVVLVIKTNAMHFTDGVITADDSIAGNGEAFQPTSVVPEPSSLALLGGGVLVFTQVLQRKLM